MVQLLPFSSQELQAADQLPENLDSFLYRGAYPPLYDRPLSPAQWYAGYVTTYLERDVRQLLNVRDLALFQRFLRLCAGRTGQLLNLSSLANDCGITHNTAKAWTSILEASYCGAANGAELLDLDFYYHYNSNYNKITTRGETMAAKTERITILGTPDFKKFLTREAKKEGISLSMLVRRRCEQQAANEEEQLLMDLLAELKTATKRAEESLDKGIESMQQTLAEIKEKKAA